MSSVGVRRETNGGLRDHILPSMSPSHWGSGFPRRPWASHLGRCMSVPFDIYGLFSLDNCFTVHEKCGISSLAQVLKAELILLPHMQFRGKELRVPMVDCSISLWCLGNQRLRHPRSLNNAGIIHYHSLAFCKIYWNRFRRTSFFLNAEKIVSPFGIFHVCTCQLAVTSLPDKWLDFSSAVTCCNPKNSVRQFCFPGL